MIDGGYYAIKGFGYQFDKAIMALLEASSVSKMLSIENIQDINTDDFVMQVKYKETQKFTPSKVKAPIMQLIDEFLKDDTKEYILYCYFNSLNGYDHIIDKEERLTPAGLDLILGKNHEIKEPVKSKFIKNFTLDFSPTFQNQFLNVLELIKKLPFVGNSNDEAILYYSQIINILTFLIINNKDPLKRQISQKQLFLKLDEGRKLIFNTSFQNFKGAEEYFRLIKAKVSEMKRNKNNFVLIGDSIDRTSEGFKNLIIILLDKFYKNAKRDIHPFTLIIPNDYVREVKKGLISQGVGFNDGYEHIYFSESLFYELPIKNRKTMRNGRATDSLKSISYKLRLISIETFEKIQSHTLFPQKVYYFDHDNLPIFSKIESMRVDGLELQDITRLL